jgi:archaellum biogenesis ATPase FlaH
MNEQFTYDEQMLLIRYMISEPNMFAMSQTIILPEYFDSKLRPVVRFILDYSNEFRSVPHPDQIQAKTGQNLALFEGVSQQANEWYLKEVEAFARYKALELAILDGVELLAKGEGGEVERRVKEAMTISIMSDLGTEYFVDPATRLERMRDRSNYVSTGWKTLDQKLLGGFTPGALNVWAGGSGSGKSLFLLNVSLNWAFMGMDVVYFSLELSEDLVASRVDTMITGHTVKENLRDVGQTALRIKFTAKQKQAGNLVFKKLPEAGTTSNDLRAYLKEYEIKLGKKPEAIVVDYLDLMHPNNRRINPSDLFVKDKYVSEELRALAGEFQVLLATASQLNRSSVEAQEFDHSHIAGGISKINTADNVFGIFTSAPMRERGIYQLQFLKTRSSSAVGQKIELAFDPISLRITDKEDEDASIKPKSSDELRSELSQKSIVKDSVKQTVDGPASNSDVTVGSNRSSIINLMNKVQNKNEL